MSEETGLDAALDELDATGSIPDPDEVPYMRLDEMSIEPQEVEE